VEFRILGPLQVLDGDAGYYANRPLSEINGALLSL